MSVELDTKASGRGSECLAGQVVASHKRSSMLGWEERFRLYANQGSVMLVTLAVTGSLC